MNGLKRIFLRLTPIIMLICFICFGISHTFETTQTGSITYLSKEVITLNDNGTPQNTADDLTIEQYKFDTKSYIQNIDQDILKRATNNVINLQAYSNTLNRFNMIWDDGYNFGDGIQTIINVGILIVNTIILPINIILTPLRFTAGIILTAFSLIGINVNKQTPIIISLNSILDYANIPMITPTYNREYLDNLNGTTWIFENIIDLTNKSEAWNMTIDVLITSSSNGKYKQIIVNKTQNKIIYVDRDNYQIEVYNSQNGWLYNDAKEITIDQNNTLTRENWNNLTALLNSYATQYTLPE